MSDFIMKIGDTAIYNDSFTMEEVHAILMAEVHEIRRQQFEPRNRSSHRAANGSHKTAFSRGDRYSDQGRFRRVGNAGDQ